MSRDQFGHLQRGTNLGNAMYGRSVEGLAARYVRTDTGLSEVLSHIGTVKDPVTGKFMTSPDFFGFEGGKVRLLEITTEGQIPANLRRSWCTIDDLVIYKGRKPH
jgi:hypothetical protein